jgi:hypothetical protein
MLGSLRHPSWAGAIETAVKLNFAECGVSDKKANMDEQMAESP